MNKKEFQKYEIKLWTGTVFIKARKIPVEVDDTYHIVIRFNDNADKKNPDKTISTMMAYIWQEGWIEKDGGFRIELQTPALL